MDYLSVVLLQGKFRYPVRPMGLNSSSCIFNIHRDLATKGIMKTFKLSQLRARTRKES